MRNIIASVVCLIFVTIAQQAFACSCFEKRSVKEEIKQTQTVFVGTVKKREVLILPDLERLKQTSKDTLLHKKFPYSTHIVKYDIAVESVYNGKITSNIIPIYTGVGGGDCGVSFEIGAKYIVYGIELSYLNNIYFCVDFPKGKNIYWTDSCLRTRPYSKEEIAEIEQHLKKKKPIKA